ncbi:Lrp/AsnC family transcriptional regulator [Aestuariispira insulae]|uniref:AsnC family transcriptional regulator n=1 Tax=Aestuariispira insulae TaxID=1461337 RepID=A0A3D9HMM4_9PROT|nr:Lrp/AsnC family transcriptional regulator [Aestuariispira insulae]RED50752.1 AsnC family transcriptional regulator [Aestuariispira insulae]
MSDDGQFPNLDNLDQQLLQMLNADAREPNASLARKLGVSRATVQNRIDRLRHRGIIHGFTLKLDKGYEASRIRAHVMIVTGANPGGRIETALERIPAVTGLYSISGKYDLIAIVEESRMDLMDVALDKIRDIPGITETTSSIILATKFDR